jgi:hypothetical protein
MPKELINVERADNKTMKCIHCLNEIPVGKKEKDHLFPKSWYPDTTSDKIQRWTIPSCSACNRAYGEIEKEMLISIGMAIESSHYASMGVSQKAINSLDHSRANNKKDRLAREATRKKITGRLVTNVSATSVGIIPNLARGEDKTIQYDSGLFIPAEHITMLCRKFVKGVTWLANKHLIDENEYKIDSFPILPDNIVLPRLMQGADYSRPPGLIIKRVHLNEDPDNALFLIIIWQQYLLYASCIRNGLQLDSPLPQGLPQQQA